MSGLDSTSQIKIGLLGASFDTGNYGVNALAESSIKCLLKRWPDAEFILLASGRTRKSIKLQIGEKKLDIPNFPLRFCKNCFMKNHYLILFLLGILLSMVRSKTVKHFFYQRNIWLKEILDINIVADITGGDSFSDIYGVRRFIQGALTKYLWMLYDKPFYFLPQTYGPFKRRWVYRAAKFLLRRALVIYSRDQKGYDLLRQMFIQEPRTVERIHFVPDVAFVLDSYPVSDVLTDSIMQFRQKEGLVAGLNISGLLYHGGYTRDNMFRLQVDYPRLMDQIASLFTQELHCQLVLIPHVFPPSKVYDVENDLNACNQIARLIRTQYPNSHVHVAGDNYSHNQMKYLIGMCDFFIGSRMHTCIAGLSQGVPTVGIAYSDKFNGVFESIGQEKYVLDARTHSNEEIVCLINKYFHEREHVRENLSQHVLAVKQAIFQTFTACPLINELG